MASVKAIGLTKRYGDRCALSDVSLEVASGSFLAVMGPSGSGKSTLLHLLGGLDKPTAGAVSIGEVELSSMDDRGRTMVRRRTIGIVFQSFNLVPVLTAEENVALPLIIDGQPGRVATMAARNALEAVGLAGRGGDVPSRMSGGEQQRVAVARATVHRPTLILADEPTGNLDSATGTAVLQVLRGHQREAGCTLVVVTHDPIVAAHADEVLHLHDGRVTGRLVLSGDEVGVRHGTLVAWLASEVERPLVEAAGAPSTMPVADV